MSFYVTTCPAGRAEGADSWTDYSDYEELLDGEDDREFDDDNCEVRRPLTYYFPGS
jgi:hypothetical protein